MGKDEEGVEGISFVFRGESKVLCLVSQRSEKQKRECSYVKIL